MDFEEHDMEYATWKEYLAAKARDCTKILVYLVGLTCLALIFVILPLGVIYFVLETYYKDMEGKTYTERLWVVLEFALSLSPLLLEELIVQATDR